ncbi:universal stress protein [Thioalkalivibrio sp. ALJ15]|uniref:universal stress protein n=1 Tax=Thioalkalivibrio sp. ALJ15 TaxID=748652 RepID=UPI00036767B8|nr:universal stress protein [Thioalkalivibrio sp. ALJ15]
MLQRVIIAVDFSPASAAALAVARQHCPGAKKRLLYVMKPSDVAGPSAAGAFSGAGTSPLNAKDMRHSAEDKVRAQLEDWAEADDEVAVAIGSAPEEISRHAEEWGADMIVMGTRGRSQIASMLSGSATEWLVRNARLPVLVVHDVPLSDAMKQKLPPESAVN